MFITAACVLVYLTYLLLLHVKLFKTDVTDSSNVFNRWLFRIICDLKSATEVTVSRAVLHKPALS